MEILPLLIAILIIAFVALVIVWFIQRSFGHLSENYVYSDTESHPGEVLYSDSLQLKGKPDYLIRKNGQIIPVEVKTGKTPNSPYSNHRMQLIAYCTLVEEVYKAPPPYGVIKYPDREYIIEYSSHQKQELESLIQEISAVKKADTEPTCHHTYHQY